MRAAHGNGAGDCVEVEWWNARGLDAALKSEVAKNKTRWLDSHIRAHRPTVLCLMEVLGSFNEMRTLRKWFKGRRYDIRFLPGEREGRKDGIVIAVDKDSARLGEFARIDCRTLGMCVQLLSGGGSVYVCAMHGLSGVVGFRRQLSRAVEWGVAHEEHPVLLCMDANHVPCAHWRMGKATRLSTADRALRRAGGWFCGCCARDD
jgi:hypothetical protein